MPHLSLTDFVDIVSASGTVKATKVRQVKQRPAVYDPATDFYRRIREGIIEAHESSLGKSHIDSTLTELTDPKKQSAYPSIAAAYKSWWGRKTLIWFNPPSVTYSRHGVDLTVNPELGLNINGTSHVIKLYFKAGSLAKNRVDIITHLMSIATGRNSMPAGTLMSVLDIRRKKLYSPPVPIAALAGVLDAELAYISALWPMV